MDKLYHKAVQSLALLLSYSRDINRFLPPYMHRYCLAYSRYGCIDWHVMILKDR